MTRTTNHNDIAIALVVALALLVALLVALAAKTKHKSQITHTHIET